MDTAAGLLGGLPFNSIDALLAAVIALSVLGGIRRGFMISAAALAALVASLAVALLFYRAPAGWLEKQWPALALWSAPIAFLLLFLVTHLLLASFAGLIVRAAPARAHAHALNRLLGLLPGAVNGVIHAAVLSLLLMALPVLDTLSNLAHDSRLSNTLAERAEWLESRITPILDPAVRHTLRRRLEVPGAEATVALPFRVASPRVRVDLEARMLEMVNGERAKQGLAPLRADPELAEVARSHSRDMFARGYFSHYTPEGKTPFDRMRQGGVRFLAAGENLALAPTLPLAHKGLMNSPGHRANILRPAFGRAGIAVLDGGVHGLMVTQKFRN